MSRLPDLKVTSGAASMAEEATRMIVEGLEADHGLLLCAASGETPTKTYARLAEEFKSGPDRFSRLRIIKLDEWGGIAMSHTSSCESYLRDHVVEPLQVDDSRYFACQADPRDAQDECLRMNRIMEDEGPIGICLLGLGLNGHLGFNEPAESLQPCWHVAELSRITLSHPMVADMDLKPSFGLTMGIADILASDKIVLLVEGRHKQDALSTLMSRAVTPRFPASFLWLHRNVTVLCDRAAAAGL